jgi:Txe/YoeB family toxin of toxin-antitoxin system
VPSGVTEVEKRAVKDAVNVERAGLKPKIAEIIRTIREDPFEPSQQFEKLTNLKNTYSRRINYFHRFVYEVLPNTEKLKDVNGEPYEGIVKIIRMWGHY